MQYVEDGNFFFFFDISRNQYRKLWFSGLEWHIIDNYLLKLSFVFIQGHSVTRITAGETTTWRTVRRWIRLGGTMVSVYLNFLDIIRNLYELLWIASSGLGGPDKYKCLIFRAGMTFHWQLLFHFWKCFYFNSGSISHKYHSRRHNNPSDSTALDPARRHNGKCLS